MNTINIIIPQMGEGVTEATITKWLVREGDHINEDQTIVEIATDKVDNEIQAPSSGKIIKIFFNEGSTVTIGETIALISKDGSMPDNKTIEIIKNPVNLNTVASNKSYSDTSNKIQNRTNLSLILSPLVKSIAQENNLQFSDLQNIKGSGIDGRITKNDILLYLDNKSSYKQIDPIETNNTLPEIEIKEIKSPPKTDIDYSVFGDVEIIEMTRMRKLIADHMVASVKTSPHVTSFIKADVTDLVTWRDNNKVDFEKKENTKLTLTPLFIRAIVKSLKEYPMINISVDENKIILKKYINIGLAAALPDGNLIVPVIKNADKKGLSELTKTVNDLANRARENKLLPDEIKGSTFTITNLGSFGTYTGTPIINQPEAAILALGTINKEPTVIETANGDAITIRRIMMLALTYDHRAIDGALAGKFLKSIASNLEKIFFN